jgi:toxin ParE1/3/4
MARAIYSSEADADIRQIVDYIGQDNLPAALAWSDRIRAVCDLLARQPGIGQRLQTARYGEVRRHVVGNYLIYYRPMASGISVVHIVHGAREQRPLI